MVQAFFHVGLHKTGTSSFQDALSAARETLRQGGILYPEPPPGAAFPEQHADIALMLLKGETEAAREYFDAIAKMLGSPAGAGLRCLLFSSEEFSNLCFKPEAFAAFRRMAYRHFGRPKCVLVLRNPIELIASELRQSISGGEIAARDLGNDTIVLKAFLALAQKVEVLSTQFGEPLIIDFEKARASGDLNNYFWRLCFGQKAPTLPNLHHNSGIARGERLDILLSQLRYLIAMFKGANAYSREVGEELDRLIDRKKLREAIRPAGAATFARLFEREVLAIVAQGYERHKPAIGEALSKIPEPARWILTRALP